MNGTNTSQKSITRMAKLDMILPVTATTTTNLKRRRLHAGKDCPLIGRTVDFIDIHIGLNNVGTSLMLCYQIPFSPVSDTARGVSDTPLQHAQYQTLLFSTRSIGHTSSARAVSDTPLQHVQNRTLLFSTRSIGHTSSARARSDTPLQHVQHQTHPFSTRSIGHTSSARAVSNKSLQHKLASFV